MAHARIMNVRSINAIFKDPQEAYEKSKRRSFRQEKMSNHGEISIIDVEMNNTVILHEDTHTQASGNRIKRNYEAGKKHRSSTK
jgi:hypothetical protein